MSTSMKRADDSIEKQGAVGCDLSVMRALDDNDVYDVCACALIYLLIYLRNSYD